MTPPSTNPADAEDETRAEQPSSGSARGDEAVWSDEEIALLREQFGEKDELFLARELGRSIEALRAKAWAVFDEPPRDGPWTEEEVRSLKRLLGAIEIPLVARMIGRSVEAIERKLVELAVSLSAKPLSADETVRFKRVFGTRTDEDLSIIFGRTVETVRSEARRLCLSKDKAFLRRATGGQAKTKMPRWSDDELELLRELYPIHSNLVIAQRLGRSVKSVVSKAHNMRLKKDKARLQQMGRQNVRLRHDR